MTKFGVVLISICLGFPALGSEIVNVLWGDFSAPDSRNLVEMELEKLISPFLAAPSVTAKVAPLTIRPNLNPFYVQPDDFYVGNYLPTDGDVQSRPPSISDDDAKWFDSTVENNQLPDVFLIGGHQVISEGWHNHSETKFLFLPTLLQTVKNYPNAKQVFDNVKFAILFGCNTMTNLEPHGADGEYMGPQEVRELYESSAQGRHLAIGPAEKVNTLEFYKTRLAREYGPHSEHFEYTRGPKREKCNGPGKYEFCEVSDLDRIMPESGLLDGTHRYNYPYMMKRLFPNAYLVIGFSSASPSDDGRAAILKGTLNKVRSEINGSRSKTDPHFIENVVYTLIAKDTPSLVREKILKSFRKHWTIQTFLQNRGRPAGSITPALPHLDADGIFAVPDADRKRVGLTGAPVYLPYEKR